MIVLLHKDGTKPLLKHILNKTYKNERAALLFNTSTGILSIPFALPLLTEIKAFVLQLKKCNH